MQRSDIGREKGGIVDNSAYLYIINIYWITAVIYARCRERVGVNQGPVSKAYTR